MLSTAETGTWGTQEEKRTRGGEMSNSAGCEAAEAVWGTAAAMLPVLAVFMVEAAAGS